MLVCGDIEPLLLLDYRRTGAGRRPKTEVLQNWIKPGRSGGKPSPHSKAGYVVSSKRQFAALSRKDSATDGITMLGGVIEDDDNLCSKWAFETGTAEHLACKAKSRGLLREQHLHHHLLIGAPQVLAGNHDPESTFANVHSQTRSALHRTVGIDLKFGVGLKFDLGLEVDRECDLGAGPASSLSGLGQHPNQPDRQWTRASIDDRGGCLEPATTIEPADRNP